MWVAGWVGLRTCGHTFNLLFLCLPWIARHQFPADGFLRLRDGFSHSCKRPCPRLGTCYVYGRTCSFCCVKLLVARHQFSAGCSARSQDGVSRSRKRPTTRSLPEWALTPDAAVFLNIPMDAETPSMRLLRPQALVQEEAIRYWATTTAYRCVRAA